MKFIVWQVHIGVNLFEKEKKSTLIMNFTPKLYFPLRTDFCTKSTELKNTEIIV